MTPTKYLIFLLGTITFLCNGLNVFGQIINIDFEDIPNTNEIEGIKISDQYFDDFGITFELENGESPTLAEVGSPVTAFLSAAGDDTPIGTIEIGSFFLTDDGLLSGLESSALIINFTDPISNADGVILDIDFTESFIIEAFGINDELLFTTIVEDGDTGTGDGLATYWEIGTDYCFEIYRLRLEGERTQAGEFGLGLDNFRFFPTVKIEAVVVTEASCGNSDASINIDASNTTSSTMYSVNGVNYQSSPFFDSLASGSYNVLVQDNENCIDEVSILVENTSSFDYNIEVLGASCGMADGQLNITSNTDLNILLEGQVVDNPNIGGLEAGDYLLSFEDELGCIVESMVNIFSKTCPFYVPNIFSPNNDGRNDNFFISTHSEFDGTFISLDIYDRWGELVFNALDFNVDETQWNGRTNGRPCSIGVYAYVLEYKNAFGTTQQLTGSIQLIR